MLASVAGHQELLRHQAVDVIQPDALRIDGITRFLWRAALAEIQHVHLAPHLAMEIHLRLTAAYPHEPRVEHCG
nr:enolase C-terminal domain-like protein [Streptomyces sp. TLI_55]